MPYLLKSGVAVEMPVEGAERVTWSDLATDAGIELRWDPPARDGDYLHARQRDELYGVLRAYNERRPA